MVNKRISKVAVIGLGNMGQHHAKAYARLDGVDFVAASDPNIQRFNAVETSGHTQYYEDYLDMLANCTIDAVSVCVPTSLHYDVATACMDAGCAVLVEKPIAQTVDQAKALVAYAKQKGVVLTVGHIERFNPAVLATKAWIESGRLGTIHAIHCKRYGPFPNQIKDADVLVDVAVHDIDIVQFLLTNKPMSASVFSTNIHCNDRADYAQLMLQFDKKLMVNIHVSWALPYKQRQMEIIGDKGIVVVDCMAQTVQYYPVHADVTGDSIVLPITEGEQLLIHKKEPIIEECRTFVRAVQTNTKPFICPEQATEALSLALCDMSI